MPSSFSKGVFRSWEYLALNAFARQAVPHRYMVVTDQILLAIAYMQAIKAQKWMLLSTLTALQSTASIYSAVLTFDDVPTAQYTNFPADYAGMQWNNFLIGNQALSASYSNGVVSSPNIAFNAAGDPASFSSANTFTLVSGYLKTHYADERPIVVRGFLAGNLIYSNAYVASAVSPTFLQFNYTNINEVRFATVPSGIFMMDDLSFVVLATNVYCTYALSPTNWYHLAGSENGSATVTTQPGCEWSVVNTNSWLTITSGLNYTNTGNVTYTVQSNVNASARSGFIQIAGKAFEVTQYPSLESSATNALLTFDDLNPLQSLLIPNNYGGLQWSKFFLAVGASSSWFTSGVVSLPNGAVSTPGEVATLAGSNPFKLGSAYLKAVGIDGFQVRVQGFGGASLRYDNTYAVSGDTPTLIYFNYVDVTEVRFSVSPYGQFLMDNLSLNISTASTVCTFALAALNNRHWPDAGNGSVTVFSQPGCEWDVLNTNTWITITSSLHNTNSASVTYALSSNLTGMPRNGYLDVAGRTVAISQYAAPGTNLVSLGEVQTGTIGHRFITPTSENRPGRVLDYLVDQNQNSGGGGVLPSFAANFDTANQFVLRISAPPGKRFLIQPPAGQAVRFGSGLGLSWQGPKVLSNGPSHSGNLTVSFSDLQGTPPDFSASRTVLSEYHGFVGFNDIQSATFTNELSFTSMTLTATVPSANVGSGTIDYNPQSSALLLRYDTPLTDDPGAFVFIVPALPPVLNMVLQPGGSVMVTFTGILQYANEADGVFEDVPGSPQGIYIISKENLTGHRYFRARSD